MWTRNEFRKLVDPPVIGMVHLRALPGSPGWQGDLDAVGEAALRDAAALADGGVGALMVENYHDVPFFAGAVPAVTVAAMTRLAGAIVDAHPGLPVGVNVLRNDAAAALAVAAATGARFVRVNVLCGAVVADQGLIRSDAARVLRLRRELGLESVGIMADLAVKHAAPLAPRPIAEEAADLRRRALADAIIVSGAATGAATDPARAAAVRAAEPDAPVLVGSGMTIENLDGFAGTVDGYIIGTSLQQPGPDGRPVVSARRTAAFTSAVAALQQADS